MENRKYTMEDVKKTIKTMLKNLHKNKLEVYKSGTAFHDIYEARIEGAEEILKRLQRKYFKETKENRR